MFSKFKISFQFKWFSLDDKMKKEKKEGERRKMKKKKKIQSIVDIEKGWESIKCDLRVTLGSSRLDHVNYSMQLLFFFLSLSLCLNFFSLTISTLSLSPLFLPWTFPDISPERKNPTTCVRTRSSCKTRVARISLSLFSPHFFFSLFSFSLSLKWDLGQTVKTMEKNLRFVLFCEGGKRGCGKERETREFKRLA